MSVPTDGFGVYESYNPDTSTPGYQARLQDIKNHGFSLVLNYNLLFGNATNLVAYINYAASIGLKVIVDLSNVAIWKTASIASTFPELYASSGNLGTESGFTTYVVGLVSGLSGTWGYYVADEPVAADHTAVHTHAATIHAADSTHPRLIVLGSAAGAGNADLATFSDSCDVLAQDYYPIGYEGGTFTIANTATVASAVQSAATTAGIQSGVTLQAINWTTYESGLVPGGWPSQNNMYTMIQLAEANMTPRLILFYSYYDVIAPSPAPANATQLSSLQAAIAGDPGHRFSQIML
jgi:hypothetical protein